MKLQTPMDLFTMELQDLYSAETQIAEALPLMAKAATDKNLKAGFEMHLKETKEQVKRLVKIAKILKIEVEGKQCMGMKGLLKEGDEVMKMQGEPMLIDAALISGARKVEHYEYIGYKGLITLAKHMKEKEVEDLLKETLEEEEMTDKKLEAIAKSDDAKSMFTKMIEEGKEMLEKVTK